MVRRVKRERVVASQVGNNEGCILEDINMDK